MTPVPGRVRARVRGEFGRTRAQRSLVAVLGSRAPARVIRRLENVGAAPGRVEHIAGVKIALAVSGAAAGLLLGGGSIPGALAGGAAGWWWPDVRLRRLGRVRAERVASAYPDALDLMGACISAGMGVPQAMRQAGARDPGPLGDAMREAIDALDHGVSRDEAYEILSRRAGIPEMRSATAALLRAERLGASVAATLADLAREAREERRARVEERARGTPVRMLFPIVVCFLPAFALLTVMPVLIVAFREFRNT